MPNRFREPVGYRPFHVEPLLPDGLLAVARPGGELEEKVASSLFRLADVAGGYADRQAEAAGKRAGAAAALAGGPGAEVDIGGAGRVRGVKFSAEVNDAINRAAAETGEDAATLSAIAQIESGGNPNAKNATSSAEGLFQQLDANAAQYGVTNKRDAYQSALGAAKFMRDNRRFLRSRLGREPTPGELYLAHQQGPGGAAALLVRPDAKASDVVGADAVRLNGGSPGMSAGEFAALWVKKFDGRYTMPEDPGQLVSSGVKLTGGRYRPSGSDTIYGRAYDEAGTRTYLQQVDTEMRSITSQIYDAYQDDPAGMQKALNAAKQLIAKQHVFDDILPEYSTGFDRMAASYLGQARDNQRRKQEQQDRAEFVDRTSQLSTDVEKKIAQLDPKNPDTADAIASAQSAIDEHYDSAVRRGIMDADDAARAKVESRRATAIKFYEKQADGLDADGVKAMRTKMEADFAKGGVAGLDGDGFDTLKTRLEKVEADKRRAGDRVTEDVQKRGDVIAARVAAGLDVPQADLAKLALDAGQTPEGKAAMLETYAKVSAGRAIADMTLTQARAHVAGLRKQYGANPTDAQLRTLAFAEKVLDTKEKALRADPVSYAEQQGVVAETPLLTDAQDASALADIVTARTEAAMKAAQAFGIPPRYLKAGEAKAVAAAIKTDPASGAAIAASIVAGAGQAAPDVLAEFGQDAPMISEAGSILAFGGSPRAAEDVILGYGKSSDGKAQKGLKPDAAAQRYTEVAGDALALASKDSGRISRAAASIARKRITEEGVEPDGDEAKAIYDQAVQEAAGATFDRGVQYGGFATVGGGLFGGGRKVLVPPTIRADRFEDVLGAITDTDLIGYETDPQKILARNKPFTKPGLKQDDFATKLTPEDEKSFRQWVEKNHVPFDPNARGPQDYDMRGFWKGLTSGDPHATTGVDPNDGRLHFTDYWKTPYHASFSAESKFATSGAPEWRGDQLVGKDGTVIFDDAARPKQIPKAGSAFYAAGRTGGGRVRRSLAATLRDATPVAVKGGYAFAYGDPASADPQFVQAEDGSVYVLDLEALAPKLATRVPEAFR